MSARRCGRRFWRRFGACQIASVWSQSSTTSTAARRETSRSGWRCPSRLSTAGSHEAVAIDGISSFWRRPWLAGCQPGASQVSHDAAFGARSGGFACVLGRADTPIPWNQEVLSRKIRPPTRQPASGYPASSFVPWQPPRQPSQAGSDLHSQSSSPVRARAARRGTDAL